MTSMTISQITMDAMKTHTNQVNLSLLQAAAEAGLLTCDVDEAVRQLKLDDMEFKVDEAPAKVANAKKALKEKKPNAKVKADSDSEGKPKAKRAQSGNGLFRSDEKNKEAAKATTAAAKEAGDTIKAQTVMATMWKELGEDGQKEWNEKAKLKTESAASSAVASADEAE